MGFNICHKSKGSRESNGLSSWTCDREKGRLVNDNMKQKREIGSLHGPKLETEFSYSAKFLWSDVLAVSAIE